VGDPAVDALQGLGELPPLSASAHVEFGAASNRGRRHEVNGDHYLIFRLGRYQETLVTSLPQTPAERRFDECGYVMIVADGMGAPHAGEAASRAAINTLLQLVLYYGKWNVRINEEIKREILERANRFLHYVDVSLSSGPRGDRGERLETSLTATFGAGGDLCFAHVGHSRAYLLRNGELMRLTRDHTTESGLPRRRTPTLVEVNVTSRDVGHIVTQTIGMGGASGPEIDLGSFTLAHSDIVLLCTNGLTDAVADHALARVLASDQTSAEKSRSLIDLATAANVEDDATALVAQYRLQS
jgi:PPM family protein phosphatase